MAYGLTPLALTGQAVLGSALSSIGLVLLWTLAALAAVLMILLLVPLHVRADGGVRGRSLSGQAAVRWAWGVLKLRLAPGAGPTLHLVGIRLWTFEGALKHKEPKKARRRGGGMKWLLEYRRHAWRLLKRLLGTLRLRVRVSGELGLGDPAATALLAQLLWELERTLDAVEIRVRPDWVDETIQLDGDLRARVWPIHIGLILLGALLRKDTRKMLRAAR